MKKKKTYHLKKRKSAFFPLLNFYIKNIPIGTHLGYNSSNLKKGWHFSMASFLAGNRNKNCVITLNESLNFVIKAFYFLTLILKSKGNLLIVNNNPELSDILEQTKKKITSSQIAYSNGKWVGGLLTNWNNFLPSAKKFAKFNYRFHLFLSKGLFYLPKYKKWEACFQGLFYKNKSNKTIKKHQKANSSLNPLRNQVAFFLEKKKQSTIFHADSNFLINKRLFSKLPTFILALSPNENKNMIKEAYRLNIPVIAITDSNTDLSLITYPIPANNQSVFFTRFCLNWILQITQKIDKFQFLN